MKKAVLIFCLTIILGMTPSVMAQQPNLVNEPKQIKAVITSIQEIKKDDEKRFYIFNAQDNENITYQVDTAASYPDGMYFELKTDDAIRLRLVDQADGTQAIFFEDISRTSSLLVIFFLFAAIAIAIGFFRGLFSLVGLAFTILVLFWFLLPQIIAGRDPILMTVVASVFILLVNIHLSHGWRLRTFFSFLGTVAGLAIVVLVSYLFTFFSSISGAGTEESMLLLWEVKTITDPVSLFIAAVILGTVGVLDDVAVTQSEVVGEIQDANPTFSRKELFFRAMRVGQHHIASTVNTLVLVYAGAALPIFILFFSASNDVGTFLNNEAVAEEFVRTIAGTISLMLTVPLATVFATIPRPKSPKIIDNIAK